MLEIIELAQSQNEDLKIALSKAHKQLPSTIFSIGGGKIDITDASDEQLIYVASLLNSRHLGSFHLNNKKIEEQCQAEVDRLIKAYSIYQDISEMNKIIRDNNALIAEAESLLTLDEKRTIFQKKAKAQQS